MTLKEMNLSIPEHQQIVQQYYLLGAYWDDRTPKDQTNRFIKEGIWENGYEEGQYEDVINGINVGDRVAIKSAYTRKYNLPFDNKGKAVSVIKIKARGKVVKNVEDGRRLEVDWETGTQNSEWYFYTERSTVWRLDCTNHFMKALIDFVFYGKQQDIDTFRNDPFWRDRYGDCIEDIKFKNLIDDYKALVRGDNNKPERYKWQCIKHFQDSFDINAKDFHKMLEESLRMRNNLLYQNSSGYIHIAAKHFPEEVRRMFYELYDENNDLTARIQAFKQNAEHLLPNVIKKHGKTIHHQQDERTISFYLTARYPEKYCFYMDTIYVFLLETVVDEKRHAPGKKLQHFNQLAENFSSLIMYDKELINLVKNTLDSSCFHGDQVKLIFQDILWRCSATTRKVSVKKNSLTQTSPPTGITDLPAHKNSFPGADIDFEKRQREANLVGNRGECLVVEYEKRKLIDAGREDLAEKIKKQQDGVGYDILSFDKNGQKILIEVKTTTGGINTPFDISLNEIERFKKDMGKYVIYRLYCYSKANNNASYYIISELDDLSLQAINFKAFLKTSEGRKEK